jgi:hypothetical protein
MHLEPAAIDRELHASTVLGRTAAVPKQKGAIDFLDVDPAVLDRLNRVGDLKNPPRAFSWALAESATPGCYLPTCAKLASLPEIVVCLTQLSRLFGSSSPARGAPRPLRPYRPFDKEAAHSPAGFVATMCIRGRGGTTMRIGGPC